MLGTARIYCDNVNHGYRGRQRLDRWNITTSNRPARPENDRDWEPYWPDYREIPLSIPHSAATRQILFDTDHSNRRFL